jgi:hypothetical protein
MLLLFLPSFSFSHSSFFSSIFFLSRHSLTERPESEEERNHLKAHFSHIAVLVSYKGKKAEVVEEKLIELQFSLRIQLVTMRI